MLRITPRPGMPPSQKRVVARRQQTRTRLPGMPEVRERPDAEHRRSGETWEARGRRAGRFRAVLSRTLAPEIDARPGCEGQAGPDPRASPEHPGWGRGYAIRVVSPEEETEQGRVVSTVRSFHESGNWRRERRARCTWISRGCGAEDRSRRDGAEGFRLPLTCKLFATCFSGGDPLLWTLFSGAGDGCGSRCVV